jgi:site-specific DNA recombinase
MKTRAAFYGRYSTASQREASIEDQARNCQKRADAEGWRVAVKFSDQERSGHRGDNPGMLKMLAAAKRKEFAVLLIDDLDRLSRATIAREQVSEDLETLGVRVVGVSDGYDSGAADREEKRALANINNVVLKKGHIARTRRGIEGQFLKGFWTGSRPYGYRLDPVFDATKKDRYGQPERVGTRLKLDKVQSKVVRDIFAWFADGLSERAIAGKLNERKEPSPGATWDRKVRRGNTWMGSAIRMMLRNEVYAGRQVWNKSQWRQTSKGRVKRERPQSEWKVREDESLRIVPQPVWDRAAKRIGDRTTTKAHSGKGPKYVLSGLLRCAVCGAHFILASATQYRCSSYIGGGAAGCSNHYAINRKSTERIVLADIDRQLLAPATVKKMAEELRAEYEAKLQRRAANGDAVPKELKELDERIARLRLRLKKGDADLAPDELQAAIAAAEQKRLQLLHHSRGRSGKVSAAKLYAALPDAARLYRKRIEHGLSGDAEAAAKARMIVRDLCGGKITLEPTKRGLVARSALYKSVLIRACGSDGSGGRI